jgi:multidrug efflux pump subunit AcrB
MTNRWWQMRMAVLAAAMFALSGGCGQHTQSTQTDEDAKTGLPKGDSPIAADAPIGTAARGPLIAVTATAPGMSTEEVETLVAQPIEDSLDAIKDLRLLRSVSREGRATVWAEFAARTNAATAWCVVLNAVHGALDKLPTDIEPPFMNRVPYAAGFMVLTLSAPPEIGPADARTLADRLVRAQLLTVPHVANVRVVGGVVQHCRVIASPERLAARALTLADLLRAVEKGITPGTEGILRPAEPLGVEQLDGVVVAQRDGQSIFLRDVAKVELSGQPGPDDALPLKLPAGVPGTPVFLAISRIGGDEAEFRRNLERRIAGIRQALPPGVKLDRKVPGPLTPVVPQLIARLQADLPPGLRLQAETSDALGTVLVPESPAPLVVKVVSGVPEELHAIAGELADDLRKLPGVADVDIEPGATAAIPELRIKLDRQKLAELGVSAADVALAVETTCGSGRIVGQLRMTGGDRRLDVLIACEERKPAELADVRVATSKGVMVRLADVAKIEATAAPPSVYRENRLPTVLVLCRVKGRAAADVAADIRRTIDKAYKSPRMLREGNSILFEP